MTDKKEWELTSYLPWIVTAVFGYLLWTKQDAAPEPTPEPKPVAVTIEKATAGVLSTMRAENARIFNEAADKIRRKEIKHSKELFDFVNSATKAARESANKPFDVAFEATLPTDSEGFFLNMEEQAAKVLERIAKSW